MTWMKLDTLVRSNPKLGATVAATGHCDAAWLWLAANTYCRDALTDGFIAEFVLPTLIPALPAKVLKTLPETLVAAGLWHRVDGGYLIHDFLHYNPTKAAVEKARAKDRDRKRDGDDSESLRNPDGFQTDSNRSRVRAPGRASSLSSLPRSSDRLEGGPGETARHGGHVPEFCAWCCLPEAFIDERLPRAGEGVTRDGLLTWARAVRTLWADVPVGESWAFWKARWSEATASVEPSAKERADFDQWRRAVGPNASGWTLDDYVRRRRAEEGGGLVAPRIDEFRERDAERTAS